MGVTLIYSLENPGLWLQAISWGPSGRLLLPLAAAAVLLAVGMLWRVSALRSWFRAHTGGLRSGADRPTGHGAGRAAEEGSVGEERFQDFFANAAVPLHIFGPDRIIVDINASELELIGYDRSEIAGVKTWADLIVPEQREQFEQHWRRLLETHDVRNLEYTLVHKDGRHVYVLLNASARYDEEGRLLNTRGSVVDITRRKEAEEALRRSEELHRTLVENIDLGIALLDSECRIVMANGTMARLFSRPVDEMIGQTCAEAFGRRSLESVDCPAARAMASGRPEELETEGVHNDGTRMFLCIRAFPLFGPHAGAIEVIEDISERRTAQLALAESEKKYRNLFETAMVGLYRSSLETGEVLAANQKLADIVGCPDVAALADEFLTAEHYVDPHRREELRRQLSERGSVDGFEIAATRGDGSAVDIAISATAYPEKGYMEGAVVDITERKRSEEALRESEERYRVFFQNSHDAFMTLAPPTWSFTSVNPAMVEMFGATAEAEMMSVSPWEGSPPRQPDGRLSSEKGMEVIQTALREGSNFFEWTHKRLDGEEFPATVLLSRVELRGQTMLQATIRDITAQKEVEAALRVSEASYRSIFDSVNDGIVVYDLDTWSLLDVNQSVIDMLGYTRDELTQMQVEEFSADESEYGPEAVRRVMNAVCRGAPQVFEWRCKRKTGELFWVEVNLKIAAIASENRILAVIHDITERKEAEAERRKIAEQIQHAQKLESLGVLAGGIAHDFNNLLVAILGNADLALMDMPAKAPERSSIEEIKRAAKRASDLTSQMLAYSGKGQFVIDSIDLNSLVGDMGRLLEVSVSRKAVLRYDFADDLPTVEVDANQIRQVVMNLITNASDAIGSACGSITLRTSVVDADRAFLADTYLGESLREGTYVCLEVSDTGCGMDDETLTRLFEPFYSTKFSGRGLGLAAVLGIVRGHRGGMKVSSEPGSGSTFEIILPAAEAGCEPADVVSSESDPSRLRIGGVVLVVDDEPSVREVSKIMLTRAGLTVLTANDGAEAVDLFRREGDRIDVVLLDMTMPKMGGPDAYRAMREIRPDVKVVLTSGYGQKTAADRLALVGLAGFIQKPFELDKLMAMMRDILG